MIRLHKQKWPLFVFVRLPFELYAAPLVRPREVVVAAAAAAPGGQRQGRHGRHTHTQTGRFELAFLRRARAGSRTKLDTGEPETDRARA